MPSKGPEHPCPPSGLKGWEACWRILDRVHDDGRRALLAELCRRSGVQGAAALGFLARMLRWHADGADYPTVPKALGGADAAYIERRAVELLDPYVGDERVPKLRGLSEKAVA